MCANLSKLPVIGFASGIGANNSDCGLGPISFKKSALMAQSNVNLDWQKIIHTPSNVSQLAALQPIVKVTSELAESIQQLVAKKQRFLVLGGDHTSAVGTWSGTAAAIKQRGSLGLIWVDAHMDSHTPQTTPSGNLHGMPLACLLGYGPPALTDLMGYKPKLLPQHLCLIGIRSFERAEAELLKRLQVRIFFMEEVKQKGVLAVLREALQIVTVATAGYGISIDLDGIDPTDAPGVSKPEQDGINGAEFSEAIKIINGDARLLGLEIAEFNPNLDRQQKTEHLIKSIIESVFSAQ